MKIAVMQPYFFPYLGYYQLLNAVDKFVLLDDVAFIKRGYIHRNSILINGKSHQFTIPLQKSSQNKMINQTYICSNNKWKTSFLKTIKMAYTKAPQFETVFPLIEDSVKFAIDEMPIHIFIGHSLQKVKEYLDITTDLLLSSEMEKNPNLKGQDRIIEISRRIGARTYINPIGGQHLYNKETFRNMGIDLRFIKTKSYIYKQLKNNFIPNLSMIDVLMFNSKCQVQSLLNQYDVF